jgi:hypothetical protein
MAEFPRSLIEFQRRFPDERACASYLALLRERPLVVALVLYPL